MNIATRRTVTILAAVLCVVGMVLAMVFAPRFFTGEPEASYTPASAQLAADVQPSVNDLNPDAPMPDPAIFATQLDAILADKPDGTKFNAQVVDVETGQVLYDRNSTANGTPASSLKLATAFAALDTLGADTQLPTTVLLDGDTLVLRGGGDVLLGDGESDPGHPKGYAGIETLAQQTAKELKKRGVTSVKLWLDDSLFGQAQNNPDWDKSLYTTNNIAPVYPIARYAGRSSENPKAGYQSDAAQSARQAFAAALGQEIQVSEGGRGAYEGGEQVAQVNSAPLREVIKYMLLVSDNYLAETMGRHVAVAKGMDPAQAGAAVASVAAEHGAQGVALSDTSGLAAVNKISPAALTSILRSAATSDKAGLRELVYSLPVAGYNGTLMQRLGGDQTLGMVRAKTGSLSGVATLTGMTMTQDGRLLAFSIFANQPNGSLAPHKPTIDQAVTAIRGCGCRG
ncbi:D-alanyl-D-alanine carboxypeptidase/D-alanyl-D-alanine-endopeptidase [Glutamicibacter sp.]|uniref:D-alanyl-D-alanine carboxypeptidase/D-alanyl-D-alanine endopeptidase n=1 Tax=Glutamicibacter sp. TaxID=1931995 RepID=UPI0028BE4A16|nr:D-alanyl-D-alanine carboxypeptidase/D-alanyl-D-alanine-endopeptidase [Glutamicibacter sp.]